MSFLLLYIGEGRPFDEQRIRSFWVGCPNISELRENAMVGAALDANFKFGNDSIIVELKKDRETIALSDIGEASIQMSFMLQSIYPEPLHVVDENHAVDFVIRDNGTSKQLAEAIYAALGLVNK
jgi:hypothetical protein